MATSIQDIPLKTIKGTEASLGDYAGKVLLIVNVASKCGLTPQYEALEATYHKYRDQGFEILGFPANDFGAQEPGTNDEIAEFCSTNFGVDFPMFAKISVKGEEQHPLYKELVDAIPHATDSGQGFRERLERYGIKTENDTDVLWNFEKFLVDRGGNVVARFTPEFTPDDPKVVEAIEGELGR
jgi:glutathione peroxidase